MFQIGQTKMVTMISLGIMLTNCSDGSYKVHVDLQLASKGDTGTYSVHLYYMLDGKRTYITETTAKVPELK